MNDQSFKPFGTLKNPRRWCGVLETDSFFMVFGGFDQTYAKIDQIERKNLQDNSDFETITISNQFLLKQSTLISFSLNDQYLVWGGNDNNLIEFDPKSEGKLVRTQSKRGGAAATESPQKRKQKESLLGNEQYSYVSSVFLRDS